jgi:7-carboxy-7-deazaguanine synthase (Cx14CxxC type)
MKYRIKEVFWSIQGEGRNVGEPSIFVRFSGCNQWTGVERDRSAGNADCARWCDTDFHDGESLEHDVLVARIDALRSHAQLVVFTGGEPLLQLSSKLLRDVAAMHLRAAVETNGTLPLPAGQCWITVSPKGGKHPLRIVRGNELKLVYPQAGVQPHEVERLEFDHFYLQPRDNSPENTRACLDYVSLHPRWRLSVQVHKYIGVR